MPNGDLKTTRDYVIATHEQVKNLKENFNEHKIYHRWMWLIIIAIPAAIYYVLKLMEDI